MKENTDMDFQHMAIIDAEVEIPPIPHGLVNLVAFPCQVKQYFKRSNYFELDWENKFVVFPPIERHCMLPIGKDSSASNIILNRHVSYKITKSFLYYLLRH